MSANPIDQAIAAAEGPPQTKVDLAFERGRSGMLVVPTDLSEAEMLMLIGLLATQVGPMLASARAKKGPRLLVPIGLSS